MLFYRKFVPKQARISDKPEQEDATQERNKDLQILSDPIEEDIEKIVSDDLIPEYLKEDWVQETQRLIN